LELLDASKVSIHMGFSTMSSTRRFRSSAAFLSLTSLLWSSPIALGQPLIIDPDDVEEIDTLEYIDEEDAGVIDSVSGDDFIVTGLVIPNDLLDSRIADQLSDALLLELENIPGLFVDPNDALRDEFEIMGAELAMECAFDPICLGRVGWDVGLDRVVIGRASARRADGDIEFTLDLVDCDGRSVLNYRAARTDESVSAISELMARQLGPLFGIRPDRDIEDYGSDGISDFQLGAAWGTLGLGVASLVVGFVFGSDAASMEDEVRNGALREDADNVYVMTQAQAQVRLTEADDQAQLANVFLGTGVALIFVSLLLRYIDPGSDIAGSAGDVSQGPIMTPNVRAEGWGIEGHITW
jgi:hypothetical protein